MGRSFTNEARRAQIMRAAIDTIAEVGYAKASFARITERADLSSPRMISYHFANKEELIHEILKYVFVAGATFIGERVNAAATVTAKLRAYLDANLRFLREHPAEIAALNEIGSHLRTETGQAYTSVSAQETSVQAVEKLLAAGHASGEFREFDVRSMAVIIRGAIDGAAQRLRDESDFDFDVYASEVITTFTLATSRS
jgi:AcrR family transcriptional regulator